MKISYAFISIILLVAISFCSYKEDESNYLESSRTTQEYQDEMNKILRNIKNFSTHYINEDYDNIAAAYTKDGVIFPPRAKIIEGTEAIKRHWVLPEDVDIIHHELNPEEIKIIEDYAYDFGYYNGELKRADGELSTFEGKYVIVWKKVGTDWKIYIDMWNSLD